MWVKVKCTQDVVSKDCQWKRQFHKRCPFYAPLFLLYWMNRKIKQNWYSKCNICKPQKFVISYKVLSQMRNCWNYAKLIQTKFKSSTTYSVPNMHVLSIFGIVIKFISLPKHGKCPVDFSHFSHKPGPKYGPKTVPETLPENLKLLSD